MSIGLFVVGFRPPDDGWRKMKAVYDACVAAGVDVPAVVAKFFGHTRPDPAGVEVGLEKHECCRKFSDSDLGYGGFEIDITKLPPGVKIVRFFVG